MTVDGEVRSVSARDGFPADSLLERRDELGAIEAALARAAGGRGSLVIVEGVAGIGKTSLLRAALDLDAAASMRHLWSSGSELEQLHPFGVARSLLLPVVRDAGGPARLRGPSAPARMLLEPSRSSPREAADPLAVLHAALWLLVEASERAPMIIVVDDLHWVDEPSLRLLAYVAHRVSTMPIAVLVGTRPTGSVAEEVSAQIRAHREAVRLPLGGLSRDAVASLVKQFDGHGHADRVEQMWEQTGGNPFYVVELLRATPPGAVLPDDVPDVIRASLARRLTASGMTARALAEAIAILGEQADLATVSRLTKVPAQDATAAIRMMVERAILQPDALAFTHPIVRAAIADGIPEADRQRLHRSAASLLVAQGRPTTAAAMHLLALPPAGDVGVVAMLRDAGRLATAQGDPSSAVRFLERALAEPPTEAELGHVLLELATAEASAGGPSASERFEAAIARLPQAHERAQARLAQGHALIRAARWNEAAAVFEAGLSEVEARDVELKSRLEAGFVSSAYVGLTDHEEASRRLQRILSAPLHDPAHRELAAWTAFQQTMAVTASAGEATALARRSLAGASLDQLIDSSQVVELVAGVLIATGDLDEEIELLDRALSVARARHAYQKVGIYSYCRSLPLLLSGRIAEAIGEAETAMTMHEMGWEIFYPGTSAALAWAHLERGEIEDARRVIEIDEARWGQRLDYQFMVRIARGRLASVTGDHAGALAEYRLAGEAGQAIGVRTASPLADWRIWQAVELRRAGDRATAVKVAEEAHEIAARWGAAIGEGRAAWALGVALGSPDGLPNLRRAVEILEPGPARLETARVLLTLGAALRRAGQTVEARETLGRAADLAHRIGAMAMVERAREELAATGARPRRYAISGIGALTPSELRVARLAVGGRTNREIAQELFVTPKAVEYHLANAYRKLDIAGRAELETALRNEASASA